MKIIANGLQGNDLGVGLRSQCAEVDGSTALDGIEYSTHYLRAHAHEPPGTRLVPGNWMSQLCTRGHAQHGNNLYYYKSGDWSFIFGDQPHKRASPQLHTSDLHTLCICSGELWHVYATILQDQHSFCISIRPVKTNCEPVPNSCVTLKGSAEGYIQPTWHMCFNLSCIHSQVDDGLCTLVSYHGHAYVL